MRVKRYAPKRKLKKIVSRAQRADTVAPRTKPDTPMIPFTLADIERAKRRNKIGRWGGFNKEVLVERMMRLHEQEVNIRDLEPDLMLMRTLIMDFIERFELFSDALLAWHMDGDENKKPKKLVDIADAVRMIESVSKVIHRMHQIENEGTISMAMFRKVLEQMGTVVAVQVTDLDTLARIEEQWASINIDTKKKNDSGAIDAQVIDRSDRL